MNSSFSHALTVGILAAAVFGASEAPAVSASSGAREVVRLTNIERARHGCPALSMDSRLGRSAGGHAQDMSRRHYFSHDSKDGRSWSQRIRRAGYRDPGGENIARGFRRPEAVVSAWMHSPSHWANILRCGFRRIGIGFAAPGSYWVQDFGY